MSDSKQIKKAYAQGFVTQAIVSGKTAKDAQALYKKATDLGNRIREKHVKIASTILADTK